MLKVTCAMPAQCMHAVDVRFTATPNWRERRARNGQNLTKSKKCTSDKKSHTGPGPGAGVSLHCARGPLV